VTAPLISVAFPVSVVTCFTAKHRLRVGEVRVFYNVSGTTVEILAIVAKSEAEGWLRRFGNPP
jgi:hypothetical protein